MAFLTSSAYISNPIPKTGAAFEEVNIVAIMVAAAAVANPGVRRLVDPDTRPLLTAVGTASPQRVVPAPVHFT